MSTSFSQKRTASYGVAAAAALAFVLAQWPLRAQDAPPAPAPVPASAPTSAPTPAASAGASSIGTRPCRARGTVMSGETPLPGASVTVKAGDNVVAVTSTDIDGTYAVPLAPGTYTVHVDLTAFTSTDQTVTVGAPPCEVAVDVKMALAPRTAPPVAAESPTAVASTAGRAAAPAASSTSTTTTAAGQTAAAAPTSSAAPPARSGRQGRNGGGGRQGGAATNEDTGFQSLSVQQSATASALDMSDTGAVSADDPAARLLPPGFSVDAPSDAVAVSGSEVQLDRGQLADRMDALGRGDFTLADAGAAQVGAAGGGPDGGLGGRGGGPGGFGGGPGGGRGFGGFGGRLGGANRLQVNANYQLGGSFLNAAPYSVTGQPLVKPLNAQNQYSTTIGGPVKIPGIYDGTGRTTFNFSYTGTDNGSGYNDLSTVPSDAWRDGDFSGSPVTIIDPYTGQPFLNNQVPVSQTAAALLNYIPHPTSAATQSNYENQGTSHSMTNGVNIRLTHSLTTPPANGRGGRGGFGGFGGGRGGRGAAAPTGWNVTLNATIGYRRNRNDLIDAFPLLDGTQRGSTLSAAETANIRHGRTIHALTFTWNRTQSSTSNPFQFNTDVASDAQIVGASTNSFYYGVPNIQFGGGLTALSGSTPQQRVNDSYQMSYTWTHPSLKHTWRLGADYQLQTLKSQSDSNPNGTFSFSGLYTADGGQASPEQAFADFLLGLPQQASVQQCNQQLASSCGLVRISARNADVFFNDDWRWKPRVTINYGVRWEYTGPYTEANGNMANLDVNSTLTAVAQVTPSSDTGPFSGTFPASLVNPDWNNVAPRVGVAWRATNRSVLRFGYGLSYNNGTYSAIAKNLYEQPPYFTTGIISSQNPADLLPITDVLTEIPTNAVTNSYAINKNYQLGLIHQFNADYSYQIFRTYVIGATYVGTIGRDLDLLLAPNQGPDGVLNPDVPAFEYQTSGGMSHANSVSLRLQKRQSHGVSGLVTYTLERSLDDTTATSGNPSLVQNAQDIGAEWGLSNFNRTQVLNGTMSIQLPWGKDRHWLAGGGRLASIVGDWTLSGTLLLETGTPLTVRCSLCTSELAGGITGTLRADWNGESPVLSSPVITPPVIGPDGTVVKPGSITVFQTSVFSVPAAGTYGNAPRNQIIGPGMRQLNAAISRDVQLGGTRSVTILVTVTNILNTVNYAAIDTNVSSSTFGQVLSVDPMRSARVGLRFRF